MHEGKLQFVVKPDWLAPNNVFAFVTTRHGGVSYAPYDTFNLGAHVEDSLQAVTANRIRMAALLPDNVRVQWLNQVHGVDVIIAGQKSGVATADAGVVLDPGHAIAILTADCLPVFFSSIDGSCVAAAHAGWRGLANGILEKTLVSLPVKAESVRAWLGPAIGPCHFEVGAEVREAFLGHAESVVQIKALAKCFRESEAHGKFYADLYGIARIRLKAAGLESVHGGGYCTYCDSNRFYSYRRESITGRFASVIGLVPKK